MLLRRLLSGVAAAGFLAAAGMAPASAQTAGTNPESADKIENFGTWSTRCEKNETGAKQCHAFVDVRIGEEKERIAYLGIGYSPKDVNEDGTQDLFMFAITPLGTFLPAGIGWSVDNKEKFSQQFMYCLPGGCQTEVFLTKERLDAIKNGGEMKVTFRIVGKGDVNVPVKLDGVSKAIAAVPAPKP
jgi:invasion protein IalB